MWNCCDFECLRQVFLWSGENRESNYHDSQGEFWPKLKQCLTDWTKEALPQSFRTRAFWLFPAFVLRHFLSHCCATSSPSLSDRELSAGEVPLDLAEFCHVVALAPLQMQPLCSAIYISKLFWISRFACVKSNKATATFALQKATALFCRNNGKFSY